MARTPIDTLPQDQLTLELKRWVDAARFNVSRDDAYFNACNEVIELVRRHPTSALRPHVLHNLGCRRRKWIRQFSATIPRGGVSDLMWQMGCPNPGGNR